MARFQLNIALDSSIGSRLTPLTFDGRAVFPTATNGFKAMGNVDRKPDALTA